LSNTNYKHGADRKLRLGAESLKFKMCVLKQKVKGNNNNTDRQVYKETQ